MEFNETWQEARSQHPLPSLCLSGQSGKYKMAVQSGLWLAETFSISPLKPLNGIQRKLTGCKISMSSTKFVFFGPMGKTRLPAWPLIGWDIFDFSSETAEWNSTRPNRKQDHNILYQVCVFRANQKNKMAALASDWLRHFRLLLWKPLKGIQQNLTGRKIITSATKFVFFGPMGKTRWLPWPLIGWDIFDSFSETAERNSTKLNRKQDLNVLYRVCVFWANRKNKIAVLADSLKKVAHCTQVARYVALWASCFTYIYMYMRVGCLGLLLHKKIMASDLPSTFLKKLIGIYWKFTRTSSEHLYTKIYMIIILT